MTCNDFLARYTEYLDDRLDAILADECRSHAEGCRDCARYDRVVRRGLAVVQSLDRIEAAPGFQDRLGRRIWAERMRPDSRSLLAAACVSFVVAGTISLAALSPLLRSRMPAQAAQPMTAAAASQEGRVVIGQPRPWWAGVGVPSGLFASDSPRLSDLSVTYPGPYSPFTIDPPLLEQPAFVRLTSQED